MDILQSCEAQEGAVLRSKFVLANTLKENGDFDEADQMFQEVSEGLEHLGEPAKVADLREGELDRYVLFCHR